MLTKTLRLQSQRGVACVPRAAKGVAGAGPLGSSSCSLLCPPCWSLATVWLISWQDLLSRDPLLLRVLEHSGVSRGQRGLWRVLVSLVASSGGLSQTDRQTAGSPRRGPQRSFPSGCAVAGVSSLPVLCLVQPVTSPGSLIVTLGDQGLFQPSCLFLGHGTRTARLPSESFLPGATSRHQISICPRLAHLCLLCLIL